MQPINIIFDGKPSEGGQFLRVEADSGENVVVGEWVERPDGLPTLRITALPNEEPQQPEVEYEYAFRAPLTGYVFRTKRFDTKEEADDYIRSWMDPPYDRYEIVRRPKADPWEALQ